MSFTLKLGADAPPFDLMGTDDKIHRLWDYDAATFLLISFTCNHFPYVVGNESREKALIEKYTKNGLVYIAISSNDPKAYPADDFPHMKERAAKLNFTWPYLFDETQSVAKAYGALKTPHFFLFDVDKKLVYVGRMDNSPRDITKATTHELADALDALIAGEEIPTPQTDPIGCTIKWSNGFTPESCDIK